MQANLAASIRARLFNVAKAQQADFNQVLEWRPLSGTTSSMLGSFRSTLKRLEIKVPCVGRYRTTKNTTEKR
jgi:hypothetical protein